MAETRQCKDCAYWRTLSSANGLGKCCHYLLDTKRMRQRDGERCLSRKIRHRKEVLKEK